MLVVGIGGRPMRIRPRAVIGTLCLHFAVLGLTPSAPGADVVFRSLRPVELDDRWLEWRSAYSVPLSVPADVHSKEPSGEDVVVYDEISGLTFAGQRLAEGPDGIVSSSPSFTGLVNVAVALPDARLDEFRRELSAWALSLRNSSCDEPFCAVEFGRSPFDVETLGSGIEAPTWVCISSPRRSATMVFLPSGAARTFDGLAKPVCDDLADALRRTEPRMLRMAPNVTKASESEVRLTDRMPSRESRVRLPDGAHILSMTSDRSARSSGTVREGEYVYSVLVDGRQMFLAATKTIEIPIGIDLDSAWLQEWTVSVRERSFGPGPRDRAIDFRRVAIAGILADAPRRVEDSEIPFTATVSPRDFWMLDAKSSAVEPGPNGEIARDDWVESVLEAIGSASPEIVDELAPLLTRTLPSRMGPGWLLVVCDDDGANYWLPPTAAHGRVANGDAFCPRLIAELARAR